MADPRVSVLIPAHNESSNLPRLFAALAGQTLPLSEFEILLLSDCSSDRTVEVASFYTATLPLRVESLSFGRPAPVRNYGATLARAPVLAFLDADCEPRPDFLARGLALAAPGTLWGAEYLLPPDSTSVGRLWAEFQATPRSGPTSFLPGGDLWLHATDFARLGGFHVRLETSEDVEFCARARAAGLRVLAFPELAVLHHGTPRTLQQFYRQNRWHGKHVAHAFFARPSLKTGLLLILSLWTLLTALALVPATAFVTRHPGWWLMAVGSLVAPPCLLALTRALPKGRLVPVPSLAMLYLVYLLARAAALFSRPQRGTRA